MSLKSSKPFPSWTPLCAIWFLIMLSTRLYPAKLCCSKWKSLRALMLCSSPTNTTGCLQPDSFSHLSPILVMNQRHPWAKSLQPIAEAAKFLGTCAPVFPLWSRSGRDPFRIHTTLSWRTILASSTSTHLTFRHRTSALSWSSLSTGFHLVSFSNQSFKRMPRRAPLPCEKSVSTFYCPSLSQTSTVGKVSSVKLFHKLSKNTASRKPTKTSSLQARNYQTTSVSKTLPGFQTPNKTAKAQARSKVPLPSSTSG